MISDEKPEINDGEYRFFVCVTKDQCGDDEFGIHEFFGFPVEGFRASSTPACGSSLEDLESHLEYMLHIVRETKEGKLKVYRIPEE
jgi:hypothetical protein